MNVQTMMKGNLLSKLGVMMMVVMFLFTAFSPTRASAHSAYFLSTTVNVGDSRYEPIILFDREGLINNHESHREAKIGYFQEYSYTSKALPGMSSTGGESVEESLKKLKGDEYVTGGIGDPFLIYTFPGLHDGKRQGTSQDLARAEWVSRTMVQSLNDAIGFVVQEAGKKPDQYGLMYLGTNLANKAYSGGSFTYKDVTFTLTPGNAPKGERRPGVNSDGYVKIKSSTGETRYFVQKVPKGYKENQPLYSTIPKDLREDYNADVKTLTWKHVVLQAHYSYVANQTTYDSFESIAKPNKVEQYFTEMGENFMLGLRSMLGLYSFGELMLNEGERGGSGYYFGIMPMSWMNSAAILHWTSMALSWMLMFLAFARVLAMRNLAAINIAKRVDLMEGIKTLIVVGFALMMFNPIFYALANFNFLLVDVMKHTSGVTSQFGSASPGAGLLSRLLISLAYLVVELYFNFIYIARGIVVAILYGTGPLFIASLAFGGKYAQIFSTYMKELVGNIYTQTFHALLVAFFASVSTFGGLRLFEQLVVLFAFIPMTKFFREATGVGGGLMDVAGAGAFGAVGSLAQSGTKKFRSNRGKWASNAKSAVSSKMNGGTGTASATSMKSASSFQGGASAGGANGSMVQNDNSISNKSGTLQAKSQSSLNAGNAKPDAKNFSKPTGNSMVENENAQTSGKFGKAMEIAGKAANVASGAASVGFAPASIAGAVGMAAVGNGSVSQNLNAVSKNPQRKSASTNPMGQKSPMNGADKQAKPDKAPSSYNGNSSYAGTERIENGNDVTMKHRFAKTDEEGYNQLYDDYGISNVSMDNGNIAYSYDYNPHTGQFNAGNYNTSEQAEMMHDMYQAFNSENKDANANARAHYEKQGITGVSYNRAEGLKVTAKKGTGGIQAVGMKDNHYNFHMKRGDNRNINLLDSIHYGVEPKGNNRK